MLQQWHSLQERVRQHNGANYYQFAAISKARFTGYARTALAEGWIDQATVDAIVAEFDAWAERPDAFQAATRCEALGWVSD